MSRAFVVLTTIHFYLPGMTSLKDKRSVVKSMLERARRHFNVSAAEVDKLDAHQAAVLSFATVSNSARHSQETIDSLVRWLEQHYPEAIITTHSTEIL